MRFMQVWTSLKQEFKQLILLDDGLESPTISEDFTYDVVQMLPVMVERLYDEDVNCDEECGQKWQNFATLGIEKTIIPHSELVFRIVLLR